LRQAFRNINPFDGLSGVVALFLLPRLVWETATWRQR
jgi:hypothetical protein